MNRKKENTLKFKSISTGQPCDEAQYVAELVCLRKAEKTNKGSLEYKFWNRSQKEDYQTQIRCARKLIKKFGEGRVAKYLNSKDGSNIYSLGFLHKSKKFVLCLSFVEEAILKFCSNLKDEKEEKPVTKPLDKDTFKKERTMSKNTLFSKIRRAEVGKKENP